MKDNQPQVLRADVGDSVITYLDYGGDGPALVLLHATGFLPWLWHPVAAALSQRCRVIAPYMCDHREEDPHQGGLKWITLAEDLAVLCDVLGLERPFMAGHSMGGTLATLAVGLFGLEAAALSLIEPIFLPQEFYGLDIGVDDHPLASKAIRRRNGWQDREEAVGYLRSKPLFAEWDDQVLDLYIQYGMEQGAAGGLVLACSPLREAALFMGSIHTDPWPLLPEVTCPVLVIEGSGSENRAYIDLQKAAALFPAGRHVMVEGAGHLIPMEKPAVVADLLRDFMAEV